jgi:hypothetical protein
MSGIAWRWLLPVHLLRRVSLSGLKFLAIFIGLWMEIHFGPPLSDHEVFLSQGASTSASGWIPKSSFHDADPFLLIIARATVGNWMSTQHKESLLPTALTRSELAGLTFLRSWEAPQTPSSNPSRPNITPESSASSPLPFGKTDDLNLLVRKSQMDPSARPSMLWL